MARKYFGTDGVRGRANSGAMTADMVLKIGMAAGNLYRRGSHRHRRASTARCRGASSRRWAAQPCRSRLPPPPLLAMPPFDSAAAVASTTTTIKTKATAAAVVSV